MSLMKHTYCQCGVDTRLFTKEGACPKCSRPPEVPAPKTKATQFMKGLRAHPRKTKCRVCQYLSHYLRRICPRCTGKWITYKPARPQLKRLLEAQGCCCKVCGIPQRDSGLHVDYDYQAEKVRGLLCRSCLLGIRFLPLPTMLRDAAAYLEASKVVAP